ncbi:hypothetical protein JXA47_08810 [Candidatus Sumerlaeota bacterium]|nr:hypothetical protein [Candidatus Sumerlaeota bacterium]
MSDRTAIRILLGSCLVAALLLFKVWSGDGIDETGYNMWLSSIIFDGDLDQSNDHLDTGVDPDFITHDYFNLSVMGCHPCKFSVGPAVIWGSVLAPWVGAECVVRGALGFERPDRFAWHLRLIVSLATFLFGCHAILLLFFTLRLFYPAGVCLAAAGVATLGSPLLIYMTSFPAMSHTIGLWAATVVWWLSIRLWRGGPQPPGGRDWALGMAVGLLTLIRWPAVVWAALPATIYIARMIRSDHRLWALGGSAVAALGSLSVFVIQMIAWHAVFGSWLTIPQGRDFLIREDSLPLVEVLFSRWNGLFLSHPWLLLALCSLPLWARRAWIPALGAMLALLATWVVNASAFDWWAGTSFGGRRWIHAMPMFALGWGAALAAIPAGRSRRLIGGSLSVLVITLNVLLALLWGRGVVREDWWGQLPMAGEVLKNMITFPLEWIDSDIWDLSFGRPQNTWLSLILLGLLTGGVVVIARMSQGGRAPWPRGRWARRLTWLVSGYFALVILVVIWASLRSPHTDQHLMLRGLLRSSWDSETRWRAVNSEDFLLDRDCPAHLAVVGALAFENDAPDLAIDLFNALERMHPRHARLQVLRLSDDPDARRHAAHLLMTSSRWRDPLIEATLMACAPDLGLLDELCEYSATPAAHRGHYLNALTLRVRGNGQPNLEWEHLRHLHARAPQDINLILQLSELAEQRGDHTESQRLRSSARRWCETRLTSFEHLAQDDALGVARQLTGEVAGWGMLYLTLLDHVDEFDVAEEISTRVSRLIQGRRQHILLQNHLFQLRWRAARTVAGQPEGQRLIDAIEEYTRANIDNLDCHLALIELWGARGDWFEACLALSIIHEQFPNASDWLELARFAAAGLDTEQLQACDTTQIPVNIRATVLGGLALRAAELGRAKMMMYFVDLIQSSGLPPSEFEDFHRRLFLQSWIAARAALDSDSRSRLITFIENYAQDHPNDVDGVLALIECYGLQGDWERSCLLLAEGSRRFPDGSDWLTASAMTADAVEHSEIANLASEAVQNLPESARPMALAGLAHRAGALEDFTLAHSLWQRVEVLGFERARVVDYVQSLEPLTD